MPPCTPLKVIQGDSMSISFCSVDDCDKPHIAKSFCTKHYKSLSRYGDALYIDNRKNGVIKKKCSVEYCHNTDNYKEKTYLTNGLCKKHEAQVRMKGTTFVTEHDRRPSTTKNGVTKIPLGKNAKDGFALVDKEFAWLDKHNWCTKAGYAVTSVDDRIVRMHHLVLPRKDGYDIDHINRNRADNRSCNLRYATRTQNLHNKMPKNYSGYKGVIFHKRLQKWQSIFKGRTKVFADVHEAAIHYNELASEHYGEFAALNIIREE